MLQDRPVNLAKEAGMPRKITLIALGILLGAPVTFLGWMVLPSNFLGAFQMFIGLEYIIGGSFFLALSRAPGVPGVDPRSDRSLIVMLPVALLFLVAVPLEYLFLPGLLPRTPVMQWIGLGIILLGMLLRIWVRLVLKKAYQGNLQVQAEQCLVTSGPYGLLRHPGYLGFAMLGLGLAVGFSSLSGLIGLGFFVFGLAYRIRIEEDMLVQAFGSQYVSYASRIRFRLIPGIWML